MADYVLAWENKDEAAFRELVTDDFAETLLKIAAYYYVGLEN